MKYEHKTDAYGHTVLDEDYFEMLIEAEMELEQEELPWGTGNEN